MGNSFSHLIPRKGKGHKDVVDTPPSTLREAIYTSPRVSVDWGSTSDIVVTDGDETDVEAVREAVRETDAVVAQFDKDMEKKTEHVLGSLEKGMQSGGLEVGCLKDVTEGLVDTSTEVGNIILNFDEVVFSNGETKDLVIQFFSHSREALEFCNLMENSVRRAQENQMWIQVAVETLPLDREPTEDECRRILQELRLFADAENPFADFTRRFTEVYEKQKKFHEKLTDRVKRLRRREKAWKVVRGVTTVMLTATGFSLVIFAAVAMALAAPLVPNLSVRAAATLPFDTMRASIHSLWRGFEETMKREKEAMDTAKWSTYVAIQDLETIKLEVESLEFEFKSILEHIEFGQRRRDPAAVQQIIPRLKRKLERFVTQLDQLSDSIRKSFDRLNATRNVVLERITPNHLGAGSLVSARHSGSTRGE